MTAWTGQMWTIGAIEKIENIKLVKLRNCDKKEQIINLKPKT